MTDQDKLADLEEARAALRRAQEVIRMGDQALTEMTASRDALKAQLEGLVRQRDEARRVAVALYRHSAVYVRPSFYALVRSWQQTGAYDE